MSSSTVQLKPEEQIAVLVKHNDYDRPQNALQVTATAIPKVADDEVLVRLDLIPVNPADVLSIQGVYPGFKPTSFPAVPGLEAVARVQVLGKSCKHLKVGQRVVSYMWPLGAGQGTWQQYIVMKEWMLVPVPDDISDEFAAMAVINPLTVVGLLEALAVPAGEFLLVTAAGSATSRMVIALAKHRGIKVIGTVRRREQREALLKETGADAVVCTEDPDWPQQVLNNTGGKGVYSTVESIGGKVMGGAITATRDFGSVVFYGVMDGEEFSAKSNDIVFRNVNLRGWWLKYWMTDMPQERRAVIMDEIWELHRKGIFGTPAVEKVYPIEQVVEAVVEALKVGRLGKILLRA